MNIKEKLQQVIKQALQKLGIESAGISLEFPETLLHGDFSTNIALIEAKKLGKNPKELAEEIKSHLETGSLSEVEKVEIAGPGFINFTLKKEFFAEEIKNILKLDIDYGRSKKLKGQKTIVEYTDPNPFKEFHIGHLMSNTIGETLSRIIEWNGAEVRRACYQGDVGLHVAKALWGIERIKDTKEKNKTEEVKFLGEAYAYGSDQYEQSDDVKKEIQEINKKVFDRTDEKINTLYDWGRKVSLECFEGIYAKLGTKFDFYFFESETGKFGKKVVEENVGKVFEKGDKGAVVFKGENFDSKLHTRVFINSEGLPTYEAKELGLAKTKFETYPYERSVVITGNEVNDYFKVLLCALKQIFPDLAEKTVHKSHGMLRLPSGKMSSRKGNVITGEDLISQVEDLVKEKIADRDLDEDIKKEIAEQVAVGAIKYSILRQSIGRNIIFDFEKSLSFEGDSGPYLQYAHTRANAVLLKAKDVGMAVKTDVPTEWNTSVLERMLSRFSDVVERAGEEYAPQYIVTYLTELASVFNAWYAQEKIVDESNPASPYKLALTSAFKVVMKNGLTILGIKTPERM
ncbi:MAG: hypothetical protein RJA61_332 [Candidatus Parcubacteria bacterium]|jgi:arginyl-tRNA synthetase